MREVILFFTSQGTVRIMAEGPNGKGTEKFTENLAKELGMIQERHKGSWLEHQHEHHNAHVHE